MADLELIETDPQTAAAGAAPTMRTRLHLATTLGLYAATAFMIPIMTDAAVSDDWVYAWHVDTFLRSYDLTLHELSTSNAVFHTFWGALFAAVFGMSFGSLRLSTVVLVALSSLAMYGLCRELGGERRACALATAAYLFNPLAFVLSYTFMTDSHFTALLVMSVYFYLRGLRTDSPASGAITGSAFAALAYLVRPHGLLIPVAVVAYLAARRRIDWSARGVMLLTRVALVPALTVLVFQMWLRFVQGVPRIQGVVWNTLLSIDATRLWELATGVVWAETMYLGFFVLPVVAAGVPRVRRLLPRIPPAARALVAVWLVCLTGGVLLYADQGRLMPYIPQFFNRWGLGPNDLLGGRPVVLSALDMGGLTLLAALCSTFWLLLVWGSARGSSSGQALDEPRRIGDAAVPGRRHTEAASLCAAVLLVQGFAAIVTSVHVPANWVSYDRYLLPLLPLSLCLGVWGLRGSRPATAGWVAVAALAVFSVAGTRDFLVLQRETWQLARWANASGMANEHLDGGAAWDGWSFAGHPGATRGPIRTPNRPPWWVALWGRPTDSSYVIAGARLPGYDVVREVEYPAVLAVEPTRIYLLRRHDVRGAPYASR